MIRGFIRYAIVCVAFIFITGCATQQNVPLSDQFWQQKKHKVAVATTKAPKPQVYEMGQQGLLDYAINSAMNKSMDAYLSRTDLSWYKTLPTTFASRLKQRNIIAKRYDEQMDAKQLNYASVANLTDSDKLLIIKLQAVGAKRNYYSVIPTGAPEAYCVMTGELIDVNHDNQVLWRHETTVSEPIQGTWDQPPNYPNLTSALKVAVNSAQQELVDSFFSGH